jgi:peptidoglycan biosynthesis protein MviN/MurJ (putative lipid II flippase)
MIINLVLALALYQSLGAGGLALSNGVAVTVEVLIMLVIAHQRMAGVEAGSILRTLLLTLLAAGVMGVAVITFVYSLPNPSPLLVAAGGGLVGVMVYLGAGLLLGLEEIRWMPRLVGR